MMIANDECTFGDQPNLDWFLEETVNSIKLTAVIFDLFIAAFAYVSVVSRIFTKWSYMTARVLTRAYQQYY